MKVLLVDQFGKTTGRDTLALAEILNEYKNIQMATFLSETTEIPDDRNYSVSIKKGFKGAYEGNFINKSINYIKALIELKKYIDKNGIDIVHLQWFSLPWLEWIYVALLRKRSKVVITVHDIIPFDNRPFEMKALNMIYDRANYLCIHTRSAANLFRKKYRTETPIKIITQGFCKKSDYKRIERSIAKKHFNISEDSIVFLFYGTIRPSKGLDLLIKAIYKARNTNNKIVLLAAGSPHRIDENVYKRLIDKYLINQKNLIKFGFVPQEEEQWYFSAADVLCLPYRELTQSGVAQLGLMYDLPIIASDVGEIHDVVRTGYNGILFQKNNVHDLEKAILDMAYDFKKRELFGDNSGYLGEKEFSIEKKALCVESVYKKLV